MKRISFFILMLSITSCSTLKKTLVYSASSGALVGGFVGRSVSPDKESDNFNTALGSLIGAGIVAGASYFLYKEARPDLKLEQTPLREEVKLQPIQDKTLSLGALRIAPPMEPISEKRMLELSKDTPKEVLRTAKKQYYRKHKTKEMIVEEDGKTFKIPAFEVIENGVEP